MTEVLGPTEIIIEDLTPIIEFDDTGVLIALEELTPIFVDGEPEVVGIQDLVPVFEYEESDPEVIVVPVPGVAGPAGPTEVFVQQDQPDEGDTAWYWFETDGAGNLTGNEFLYDPDDL
jgi:hypothetical protein